MDGISELKQIPRKINYLSNNTDYCKDKYTIVLISLHGRVSYQNMQLGIDLDTGGQVKYVVEMAYNLSNLPEVEHVYLLTRLINDKSIDTTYHKRKEYINDKSTIIRLPCGPVNKYLRKELLWPYIWEFIDESYNFIKNNNIKPNIIHGHYSESCEIAINLSNMLNVPSAMTGHSLGRNKLKQLIRLVQLIILN